MSRNDAVPLMPTDTWYNQQRLAGLWRFAVAISILNTLGYTVLGFEPAWGHPLIALAAAYLTELGIEGIDAFVQKRRACYLGGLRQFVEFLLPAHITGLAISMLLYPGQRFWVIAFAACVAVASKTLFRVSIPIANVSTNKWPIRHFLNPSNFGIAATLLLFPSVSIAPPYHFTEDANALFHWVLPLLVIASGSFLNTVFTKRVTLILTWVCAFVLQAVIRETLFGNSLIASLMPMTGLAFVLFSFYMVTDPATTPSSTRGQIIFGCAVAFMYGTLVAMHIAFGLFFSLATVTAVRGILMYVHSWQSAAEMAEAREIGLAARAG
jgi:Na+-translocating ferredoxin:NAD+ oxidoreductase RnfD subunit